MKQFLLLTCFILSMCLLLDGSVNGDITIDGDFVHVETDNYTVQFYRGSIDYIHNKLTDETYTLSSREGKHGWTGFQFFDSDNRSTHWASLMTKQIDPLKAELLFQHNETEIRLFIAVDPMTDDLLIDLEGVSDRSGVVGAQWGISYLDIQNLSVIAPVDNGRIITATTPLTYLKYPYPFSSTGWEAQLAIVQSKRGGFYVRNTDNTLQFKWFVYNRGDDDLALEFGTYNQAPFHTHTTGNSQMWRFNTYAGDWRVPARIYRDWMERVFDARRLSEKAAWLEDVTLFIGSATSGIPLEHAEYFDAVATKVDPTKTVLMKKQWTIAQEWSRDAIDTEPIYEPAPELGNLLEDAKGHGFRVMLYAGFHAFSPKHPLYPEFVQYEYRDTWTGELTSQSFGAEFRDAQINAASSAFREILVNELKDVWDAHDFDGFFLDTSYYAINDGNGLIDGLNSAQGGALLYRELAEAMPGAIFAGERHHEGTFALESFAQIPVGVGWAEHIEAHPISSFLFSPFTHVIHHAIVNPDHDPVFHQKVLDYSGVWGIMPTIITWKPSQFLQPEEWPNTQQVLASAGSWQHQYGLNGDVNGDGTVNVLDLTLVGQNFGVVPLTHIQTDVNGDGTVNALDLIGVVNMFEGITTAR